MFTYQVRQPFFKLDEADGGWDSVFIADKPADDGQPPADPDADDLETDETDNTKVADSVEDDLSDVADGKKGEEEEVEEEPFNDDTEITIGEGQAVKLKELKDGYLRQSDYTKKTQALADERKTFEAEQNSLKPVRDLNAFLNANPYLREQIHGFIQEFTTTGNISIQEALADASYGQYINSLMAQRDDLIKQLQDIKGKYGELEFSSTIGGAIADLKAEYGALLTPEYEQELRAQAKTENLKPEMLKRIAKGDLAELKLKQNNRKAKDVEAETIQKIQENRNALPSQPKSKGQKPQVSSKSIEEMSWAELLQSD